MPNYIPIITNRGSLVLTGPNPVDPSNFTATAGTQLINASWTPGDATSKFNLFINNENALPTQPLVVLLAGSNQYQFQGLAGGQPYWLWIQAFNTWAQGTIIPCNPASVTPGSPRPPNVPTNLSATTLAFDKVTLVFQNNGGGDTGIHVDYSTDPLFLSPPPTTLYNAGPGQTNYIVRGLTASTTYSFRVRTNNAAGDSGNSNTASATTSSGSSGGPNALVTISTLPALQNKTTSGNPAVQTQWNGFSGKIAGMLDSVVKPGYQGSTAVWMARYMLTYLVTGTQSYFDSALGLMKSFAKDYAGDQIDNGWMMTWAAVNRSGSSPASPRGDGSTTKFTTSDHNVRSETLAVRLYSVKTIPVVHKNLNQADAVNLGYPSYILKVSNTSDGSFDYVQNTDWMINPMLPQQYLDWGILHSNNQPAQGATYYITLANYYVGYKDLVLGTDYTLSANGGDPTLTDINFTTAPTTSQMVAAQYLFNTATNNYQQSIQGSGGLCNSQVDLGYAAGAILAQMGLAFDWGYNNANFSAADQLTIQNYMNALYAFTDIFPPTAGAKWGPYNLCTYLHNGFGPVTLGISGQASNYHGSAHLGRVIMATVFNARNIPSNAVVSITQSGMIATVQSGSAHGFNVGDAAVIRNNPVSNYNGIWTVISVIDSTHFTFNPLTSGLPNSVGGVLGYSGQELWTAQFGGANDCRHQYFLAVLRGDNSYPGVKDGAWGEGHYSEFDIEAAALCGIIAAQQGLNVNSTPPWGSAEETWAEETFIALKYQQIYNALMYDHLTGLPFDGYLNPLGAAVAYPQYYYATVVFSILSGLVTNATLLGNINYQIQNSNSLTTVINSGDAYDFIFRNPAATATSDYFSNSPTPALEKFFSGTGAVIAKSNTTNNCSYGSFMLGNPLKCDHQYYAPGLVEIWRNGVPVACNPLLIALWQPSAETNPNYKFNANSYANCPVIDDLGGADGQLQLSYRYNPGPFYGSADNIGEAGIGPIAYSAVDSVGNGGYVHAKGDLSLAWTYGGVPYVHPCTESFREMIYLRNDHWVYYDRFTTNQNNFPKRVLWHNTNTAPTVTSGNFRLNFSYNGNTQTTDIPYNVTAASLQSTLQALTNVGSGNVVVGQIAQGTYAVTFQGTLAKKALPLLTASNITLGPGSCTVVIESFDNQSSKNNYQRVILSTLPSLPVMENLTPPPADQNNTGQATGFFSVFSLSPMRLSYSLFNFGQGAWKSKPFRRLMAEPDPTQPLPARICYVSAVQSADANTPVGDTVTHLVSSGNLLEGVQFGTDIAMFGVGPTLPVSASGGITYSFTGSSSNLHVIADLNPGHTYTVELDGTTIASPVASSAGEINFTTTFSGSHTITITGS